MAKTPEETIKDLQKKRVAATKAKDDLTREVARLTQRAQELRNAIISGIVPADQKRRNREVLPRVVNKLRTAQQDEAKQDELIRQLDAKIAEIKKSLK